MGRTGRKEDLQERGNKILDMCVAFGGGARRCGDARGRVISNETGRRSQMSALRRTPPRGPKIRDVAAAAIEARQPVHSSAAALLLSKPYCPRKRQRPTKHRPHIVACGDGLHASASSAAVFTYFPCRRPMTDERTLPRSDGVGPLCQNPVRQRENG